MDTEEITELLEAIEKALKDKGLVLIDATTADGYEFIIIDEQ